MRAVRRASISGSSSAPGTAHARATSAGQRHRPHAEPPAAALHRETAEAGAATGRSVPEQPAERALGGPSQRARLAEDRGGLAQHLRGQLDRPLGQRADVEAQPRPVARGQAREIRAGPLFQVAHHRARGRRGAAERLHHRRAGELRHEGQQVVANAVAEEAHVAIARVLRPGEPAPAQVLLDRGPPGLDQRADQRARAPARCRPARAGPRPAGGASARSRPDRRRCGRWRCARPRPRGPHARARRGGPGGSPPRAHPRAAPGAP